MANLHDQNVRELLEQPNYATVSTLNEDGSVHSAVAWIALEDGELSVNSARGRVWPTNLERDPRITVVVYPAQNPYEYVEVRGQATGTREDADDHINRLSKKYIDQDEYPFRQPGEERLKFIIKPAKVRYQKQG
ncbi:MAG: PPOX class F420-dependent oxidoreductase [Actinomycetota bacterium]|nr:PPOX class F420-dependent oxidoreductase [Actinomycetota bacterium]